MLLPSHCLCLWDDGSVWMQSVLGAVGWALVRFVVFDNSRSWVLERIASHFFSLLVLARVPVESRGCSVYSQLQLFYVSSSWGSSASGCCRSLFVTCQNTTFLYLRTYFSSFPFSVYGIFLSPALGHNMPLPQHPSTYPTPTPASASF